MMMNWEGYGRKRSWPNFKVPSLHSPGGPRKTTKISMKIAGGWDGDSNAGSPEYEAGMLTNRPRRSVINI
jgi:hypothetical protein